MIFLYLPRFRLLHPLNLLMLITEDIPIHPRFFFVNFSYFPPISWHDKSTFDGLIIELDLLSDEMSTPSILLQ